MSQYVPSTDAALKTYGDNFALVLSTQYAAYGLSGADYTLISGNVNTYDAAFVLANDPNTRTKPIVAAKDAARHVLIQTIRQYSQRIKRNGAVTNEMKTALGIHVDDPSPTPVPTPTTQPLLTLPGATPLQHTVRFADASTPAKRAKPAGATGMILFVKLGTAPALSPAGSNFVHIVTKQPFVVNFNPEDVGQVATYFAKWVNRRGDEGPWSSPVSMTVAG